MPRPLRLEAQDTALSRRQHRFESGRGRHGNQYIINRLAARLHLLSKFCLISALGRSRTAGFRKTYTAVSDNSYRGASAQADPVYRQPPKRGVRYTALGDITCCCITTREAPGYSRGSARP